MVLTTSLPPLGYDVAPGGGHPPIHFPFFRAADILSRVRSAGLQVRDLPCPLLGHVWVRVGIPSMARPARFSTVGHVEEEALDQVARRPGQDDRSPVVRDRRLEAPVDELAAPGRPSTTWQPGGCREPISAWRGPDGAKLIGHQACCPEFSLSLRVCARRFEPELRVLLSLRIDHVDVDLVHLTKLQHGALASLRIA